MKKIIVSILAGIALGTTTTAIASTEAGYWNEDGPGYTCSGVSSGMYCKSGGYEIGITKDFVFLKKGYGTPRNAATVGCYKWRPWSSCYTP